METKTIEINFFCDESGHLHSNSAKRYFVIGGYFCLKEKSVEIRQRYTRTLKKIKEKRGMGKPDELKARDMTQDEKIKLLITLQESDGFNGFAFVVDKDSMWKKINKESIYYNYFIKLIVKDILVPKTAHRFPEGNVLVDMLLDSRNVSVGHLKSLEDYLNSEYLFERFSFIANYKDSKTDTRIQATDLIANTIYELFKEPEVIDRVIPHLDNDRIIIIGFPNNQRMVIKNPRKAGL